MIRFIYPYFLKQDEIIIKDLPLLSVDEPLNHFGRSQEPVIKKEKDQLFVFDPNTVSYDQLLSLGFSGKTAGALIKFRNKGFIFKTKPDLKKVYGVTDDLYSRLEPYILIPGSQKPEQISSKAINEKPTSKSASFSKIELNSADSAALVSANGIGPVFARRILKYRNLLGGFVSVEQLKEVYGFNEEIYIDVKDNFKVDAQLVKKLNLNKDDFKTVNKHPYLTYELTGSIFNLRRKTSVTAANLKDLINDDVLYAKVLPYLSFD
ncbi:MAG: helix-hairpin-helix domain-containing protein [Bacteroidia bacterium]|nr:helix-hairpin-helix domain-containing protein [Bacteroidia bacterium]